MYFVISEKYPWYFFVTKKKEEVPQAIFEKYHGTFLVIIMLKFVSNKRGVGVFRANFEKYLGTFLLFNLRRGWVGGKIGIFEKSPYVPSKKYLHPPFLTLFLYQPVNNCYML